MLYPEYIIKLICTVKFTNYVSMLPLPLDHVKNDPIILFLKTVFHHEIQHFIIFWDIPLNKNKIFLGKVFSTKMALEIFLGKLVLRDKIWHFHFGLVGNSVQTIYFVVSLLVPLITML